MHRNPGPKAWILPLIRCSISYSRGVFQLLESENKRNSILQMTSYADSTWNLLYYIQNQTALTPSPGTDFASISWTRYALYISETEQWIECRSMAKVKACGQDGRNRNDSRDLREQIEVVKLLLDKGRGLVKIQSQPNPSFPPPLGKQSLYIFLWWNILLICVTVFVSF